MINHISVFLKKCLHKYNLFFISIHEKYTKKVIFQAFTTPNRHPQSKPFFDHAFSFSYLDGRIWFRHFQILWDGETVRGEIELNEIGPRFVLQPIRIFSGSFHGETIYRNEKYVSPNTIRSDQKRELAKDYEIKKNQQKKREQAKQYQMLVENPIDTVFKTEIPQKRKRGNTK